MDPTRFQRCFPSGDVMVCQHLNGNWIVFPIIQYEAREKKETPSEEEVSVAAKL